MPLEPVTPSLLLRDQVLEAVLPHHLHSGLGELRHLVRGDVLRRDDDAHAGPDLGPEASRSARGGPQAT